MPLKKRTLSIKKIFIGVKEFLEHSNIIIKNWYKTLNIFNDKWKHSVANFWFILVLF